MPHIKQRHDLQAHAPANKRKGGTVWRSNTHVDAHIALPFFRDLALRRQRGRTERGFKKVTSGDEPCGDPRGTTEDEKGGVGRKAQSERFSLVNSDGGRFAAAAVARMRDSSPRTVHSSRKRFSILGTPASCASRLSFSSWRESRVDVSSGSKRQPPSPSNWSRCEWNFLHIWMPQSCHLLQDAPFCWITFIFCRNTNEHRTWVKLQGLKVAKHVASTHVKQCGVLDKRNHNKEKKKQHDTKSEDDSKAEKAKKLLATKHPHP